jgi:hypothetical protein
MHVKPQIPPQRGQCLMCGKRLGLFRRLTGSTFCCKAHDVQYLADLQAGALHRLQDSVAEPSRTRSTVV